PEVARVIGSATSVEPARLPPPRLEEPVGEPEPVGSEETHDSGEGAEKAETELGPEEDETNETDDRVP
ncbi:MAG: hypothetical protein ACRD1X_14000, partial [Vicinamibacteria bacterium]